MAIAGGANITLKPSGKGNPSRSGRRFSFLFCLTLFESASLRSKYNRGCRSVDNSRRGGQLQDHTDVPCRGAVFGSQSSHSTPPVGSFSLQSSGVGDMSHGCLAVLENYLCPCLKSGWTSITGLLYLQIGDGF
ncbi:hypothetical protein AV530_000499 [Patagioenas fasciata monilis]|uniref:Uncharacterized protein n=1 Tax=Patagioenas fasciata monilis TaxID=372326 RepID=A0A1V4IGR6_PATFA|nr:hypothetical protein AV530_000499 [Patagioenas fasciata monilis]